MRRALYAMPLWLALTLLVTLTASAAPALTRLSRDPYTNPDSQHRTQVEPDTFAYNSTVVAAFQTGRFYDGGASNIGWSTSRDGGATWTRGFLPNTTTFVGGPFARISDPSVAYDAKHGVWLINSLSIDDAGQGIIVNRSTDDGLTWDNPIEVTGLNPGYDKNWIVCDNWVSSPYYGNCYIEWDDANAGLLINMATSTDGGLTWSAPTTTVDAAAGIGGQPVVLPDGRVIVPFLNAAGNAMYALRSTDGGASWGNTIKLADVIDHQVAGGLRTFALPSAEVDGGGRIYLVWQDCRFIRQCRANDIVMTTSTDGVTWTRVKRIPLDPRASGVDHFIPGIAADPNSSGNTARLGLTYYYYPKTNCTVASCRLNLGFASSTDGGAAWTPRTKLAGPMRLAWLPYTTLGYMVGDYISTSIVNGNAVPVFAVAREKRARLRQFMFAPTNGLPLAAGNLSSAEDLPEPNAQADHPPLRIQRIP